MDPLNPYQPPQGEGLDTEASEKTERPVYDTRWQATRAGIWRGTVLGTKILAIASVFVLSLGVVLIICMLLFAPERLAFDYDDLPVFALKVFFAFTQVIFFFGAIPGGIILGLIEAIRFRKPK